MKKFLSDKRIRIVMFSCLVVALLSIGGFYAVRTVAKNSSIGGEAAKHFAYIDAKVNQSDVNKSTATFTYYQGNYVYNVDFTTDKVRCSYIIKADDGTVLYKKTTKIKTKDSDVKKKKKKKKKKNKNSQKTKRRNNNIGEANNIDLIDSETKNKNKSTQSDNNSDNYITVDEAKAIAKSNSGEGNVVFTTAQMGTDNGLDVYYIFFTGKKYEYHYIINAKTADIVSIQKIPFEDPDEDEGANEGDDYYDENIED